MKNGELMGFVMGLQKVMEVKGTKFAYAVAKNMKAVGNKLAVFQSMRAALDPGYQNYDAERIALAEKLCEKIEAGKPKIENNNYVFTPENRALFDVELAQMQEIHKEALERRQKKDADFSALMEERCDIVFHKIGTKDLPSDLTAAQIMAIEPMLTEMALVEDPKKVVGMKETKDAG